MWEEELAFISQVTGVHQAWLMAEQNGKGGLSPDAVLLPLKILEKLKIQGMLQDIA